MKGIDLYTLSNTGAYGEHEMCIRDRDITGSAAVREVKLLAGKAVVKGEVRAQCLSLIHI